MAKPILFTPYTFLDDFLAEAAHANHSIYLQSMNFETGGVLTRIEKVLSEALLRGVRVNINRDWVSDVFVNGRLPLLPTISPKNEAYRNKLHKDSQAIEERLRQLGATIIVTNTPSVAMRLLPMIRRNHIKLYLVDEKIGWLGGVNLFDDSFERLDIMVRFDEGKIVQALKKQFFMVNALRSPADYHLRLSDTETLFVDTGRMGSSIIYSQAMEEIDKAEKHILFISQFVPDGQLLAKLIAASKRGVRVEVLTSVRSHVLFRHYPTRLVYLYFRRRIKSHPEISLKHLSTTVHAKLLIIDHNRALFGSHNYTYSGVLFGTEELMMETKDEGLVKSLEKLVIGEK